MNVEQFKRDVQSMVEVARELESLREKLGRLIPLCRLAPAYVTLNPNTAEEGLRWWQEFCGAVEDAAGEPEYGRGQV